MTKKTKILVMTRSMGKSRPIHDTYCDVCHKALDTSDMKIGDFIPHCMRFSVVGNAKYKQTTGALLSVPKKRGVSYGPLVAEKIREDVPDTEILKEYPIKPSYLKMIHYKLKRGVVM